MSADGHWGMILLFSGNSKRTPPANRNGDERFPWRVEGCL